MAVRAVRTGPSPWRVTADVVVIVVVLAGMVLIGRASTWPTLFCGAALVVVAGMWIGAERRPRPAEQERERGR